MSCFLVATAARRMLACCSSSWPQKLPCARTPWRTIEPCRAQLVALSGDLDVSQQKQRALQQQLAAEQVGSHASFEAVE